MTNLLLILLIVNLAIQIVFKQKNTVLGCGLVGFSGKKNCDPTKVKLLLLYNQTRGEDSTGLYSPLLGEVDKGASKAYYWLANNEVNADKLIIGHTRAKTVGVANVANAHPFHYGTTIGAHNGTLKNHWEMCKDYGLQVNDYNVDSQVLIKLLDLNKDPRVLFDFEGAAAVLFTNEQENTKKSNTLYAFRNKERPLFYGKTEEGIYISSIEPSLEAIGCTDIEEFPTNTLHKIKDGEIISVSRIPREQRDVTKITPKKSDYTGRQTQFNRGYFQSTFPIGSFVEIDPNHSAVLRGHVDDLTPGKLYEIIKHDEEYGYTRIGVKGDNGKLLLYSRYHFLKAYKVEVDSYAKAMIDLHNTKTGEHICTAGDVVRVVRADYGTKEVDFVTNKSSKVYITGISALRGLKDTELQASFDFKTINNKEVEEETEEEASKGDLKLEGLEISGSIVDEFLDNLSEDLMNIQNAIKESKGGYLSVNTGKELDKAFSEVTSSIYEFVYEAGGEHFKSSKKDKKKTCPTC